ncbi:MAG: hypothetical protein LIP01_10380 [Tannerellaceae bacterium]|nr:hypothetical protein [Tannerellaceae bacterium]
MFSTWSPPAYMKTTKSAKDGGRLEGDEYQNFAEYLSEFSKAFGSIGLQPYAVSPVNEPEFAASWNSCLWSAEQTGNFLMNYMGPLFKEKTSRHTNLLRRKRTMVFPRRLPNRCWL